MNPLLTLIRPALRAIARPGGRRLEFPAAVHALEPCRVPARLPVPVPARKPRVLARVIAATLAIGAAALLAGPASAQWSRGVSIDDQADGRLVDVRILVDGQAAPLYTKSGQWDRRYLEAFRGRNYAIELRNNTSGRVGVLIAVDGLNVVNGERSSLSNREPMYVLGPWERAVIRGWRTSLADVRRFVFVDEQRSYAERTGQANGDMGWIRVLAFREDRPAWYRDVWQKEQELRRDLDERAQGEAREEGAAPRAGAERRAGETPAPSAAPEKARTLGDARSQADSYHGGPAAESFPGTGWGDRHRDPVREVEFLAERRPTDRLVFRYEYASGLHALGIFPSRDRLRDRERGELGFAKPPQW